jgi:hypothetical protein
MKRTTTTATAIATALALAFPAVAQATHYRVPNVSGQTAAQAECDGDGTALSEGTVSGGSKHCRDNHRLTGPPCHRRVLDGGVALA